MSERLPDMREIDRLARINLERWGYSPDGSRMPAKPQNIRPVQNGEPKANSGPRVRSTGIDLGAKDVTLGKSWR